MQKILSFKDNNSPKYASSSDSNSDDNLPLRPTLKKEHMNEQTSKKQKKKCLPIAQKKT